MKTTASFFNTTVTYKKQEVQGLCLPASVQRLTNVVIPNGYQSVGKQRFADGFRICFIQEHLIEKIVPKTLKVGEYSISGYTTNLEIQETINNNCNIIKACFLKDPSINHKEWITNRLLYNMGLNNWHNIAYDILKLNWNNNPNVITPNFETYFTHS
jgi:hypothetical protein